MREGERLKSEFNCKVVSAPNEHPEGRGETEADTHTQKAERARESQMNRQTDRQSHRKVEANQRD